MKRKWNNQRNFNIDNYIHLTFADYVDSVKYNGGNLSSLRERTKKKLDNSFSAQTGYSVKEFMEIFKNKMEGLRAINNMLNQNELKNLGSSDSTSDYKAMLDFLGTTEKADFFKSSSEIITEANILNALSRDRDSVKAIVERYDKITTFPMYDIIMGMIEKDSNSDKTLAMKLALINDILEKYKTGIPQAKNIIGDFDYVSIETAETAWQNIMNELSLKKPNISSINKNITVIKKIINTVIKGANLGEQLAKLSASSILNELIEDSVYDKIGSVVEATGRKAGTTASYKFNPIHSPKTGGNIEFDLSSLDAFQDRLAATSNRIEKLADVTITLKQSSGTNKKLGISAKMYDPKTKFGIALGSGEIGALLAMGDKIEADRFFSQKSKFAQSFLNAMNFLLAQSDFSYTSDKKMWEVKSRGAKKSIKELDAISGGTISDLGMSLFSSLLGAERIAFMNINGALVPTPTYYDFCMDSFTRKSKTIMSIGQIVSFGARNGSNYTKTIKQEGSAKDIDKIRRQDQASAKELVRFGVLAASRNVAAKGLIIKHRVSVSGYYIKPEDYKSMRF